MSEAEPTVEEQATELGWTPQEAWVEKGNDPEKWRDAEQFLEFGEQNAKFVRRSLQKDFDKQLEEIKGSFETRLQGIEKTSKTAMEKADYIAKQEQDTLRAQLQLARDQAASNDDLKAYSEASEQLQRMDIEPMPGPAQVENPSAAAFNKKMVPLIMANTEVRTFADVTAAMINRDNPNIDPADFYKELETQIKDEFSDRNEYARFFGKKPKAAKVDTSDTPPESSGKTYADLPPEAKKACDGYVADENLNMTREDYISSYFGE